MERERGAPRGARRNRAGRPASTARDDARPARPLELRDAGGTLVVEIDLDEVSFRRPPRGSETATASPPGYEVEIELRDGDEAEIPQLIEELRRDYPLEPMRLSKLERALRWAGLDR